MAVFSVLIEASAQVPQAPASASPQRFSGIGATLSVSEKGPVITGAVPNSPAANAGLMPGSVITRIDDKPAAGMALQDCVNLIRGAEGTEVSLEITSPNDGASRTVLLKRAAVALPASRPADANSPTSAAELRPPGDANRVLQLDGNGSLVELPADAFKGLDRATIEGWVKMTAPGVWSRMFDFGARDARIWVGQEGKGETIRFNIDLDGQSEGVSSKDSLVPGKWLHVACVSGPGGIKFYIDGVLAGSKSFTGSFASFRIAGRNFLGRGTNPSDDDYPAYLFGQIDEVRVWNVERTVEQIRDNIAKQLTGSEPGLVGLWNFDDPEKPGRDASPNHHDGKLIGNARAVQATTDGAAIVKSRPGGGDALMLNGVNTQIESESGWFADVSDSFTMEFWALPTLPRDLSAGGPLSGTHGQRYILFPVHGTKELGGDPHAGVGVSLGINGVAVVEHAADYMPLVVDVQTPITNWVHVAVVYRDKTPSLYLNGTLAGTGPRSQRTVHPSLWCWKNHGNNLSPDYGRFAGTVDDVRIWNMALTVEQIRENILKQLTGSEPGLVGLWNFDDPANPGRDASPNHRDGKLVSRVRAAAPSIAGGAAPSMVPFAGKSNRVLELDGNNSYVELPPETFADRTEATIECWAKWDTFELRSRVFDFALHNRMVNVRNEGNDPDLWVETYVPEKRKTVRVRGSLRRGEWVHLAVVTGPGQTKLYVNGTLQPNQEREERDSFRSAEFSRKNLLGRSNAAAVWPENRDFRGYIDEVRVWTTARSEEQIRENILKQLTGSEPGLVALWNFDDPANPGRDASPNHHDGKLVGNARAELAKQGGSASAAQSDGIVPASKAVLDLDGKESFVELPPNMVNDLDEATVEGWVKWDRLGQRPERFFDYGAGGSDLSITTHWRNSSALTFVIVDAAGQYHELVATKLLRPGEWLHVAGTSGKGGMKLYVNGELVAQNDYTGSFSALKSGTFHFLGKTVTKTDSDPTFQGQMADVRLWKVARSSEQIRDNMLRKLTGEEPDLVGLWTFDDPANPGRDASQNQRDGKLVGGTRVVEVPGGNNAPSASPEKVSTVTISGMISDVTGKPLPGAEVQLLQGSRKIASAKSGLDGSCFLITTANEQPYRLIASFGQLEAGSAEAPLKPGPNRIDLQVRDTLRISGTLFGSDGQPRRGVKVEAVSATGGVAGFSVSDAKGIFNVRRLSDGEFKLRASGVELDGGKVFTVSADAPVSDLKPTLSADAAPGRPAAENRVLTLDGSGAHVNLPVGMFENLRETTIEAWARFSALDGQRRFFSYGSNAGHLYLGKEAGSLDLFFGSFPRQGGHSLLAREVLEEGRWCHVAVVIDALETRLYFNGIPTGTGPKSASFVDFPIDSWCHLGWWAVRARGFSGGIDEVRVWAKARTGEEIRATMFKRLSGGEEGLAALWNFDEPNHPGKDATPNGFDGGMVNNAAAQPESLPAAATEIAQWASLSGVTLDVDGRPLGNVKVHVERGDEHLDVESDFIGNFSLLVRGSNEPWRVTAARGDLSATPASVVLVAGEHSLVVTLRDAAPLSGHLRAPDGSSLPAVVVQALPVIDEGAASVMPGLSAEIFNTGKLTDFPVIPETTVPIMQRIDPTVDFALANGSISGGSASVTTRFFARWKGRLRIGKGGEYTFRLAANDAGRLFIDGRKVVEVIRPPSQTGTATLETNEKTGAITLDIGDHEFLLEYYNDLGRDGLRLAWSFEGAQPTVVSPEVLFHERAKPTTQTVMSDARGRFRFPTAKPGRYTLRAHVPGGFAAFENDREVIVETDKQIANLDFTLARFKRGRWKTWSHQDGLPSDNVTAVFQAADGALWFGTDNGAARFDGRQFLKVTVEDGLPAGSTITAIDEDTEGRIWLGSNKGLCLYDPKAPASKCVVFTTVDALTSNEITELTRDKSGRLWIGTTNGLCHFDPAARQAGGKPFVSTRKAPIETVKDLAPGAHHGTLVGAARFAVSQRPAAESKPDEVVTGKVLQFDGNDSYVELPSNVFNDLTEATVEGWVKWNSLRKFSRFFDFGNVWKAMEVCNRDGTNTLYFSLGRPPFTQQSELRMSVPGLIEANKWCHIAVVTGPQGVRIYFNGAQVASNPYAGSFSSIANGDHNYLGRSNWRGLAGVGDDEDFDGEMDEVRVWKVARSPEQIVENMTKRLTGSEPGLAGLWNFDETVKGEREVPIAEDAIRSLRADSKGGLWIGTDRGVSLISASLDPQKDVQTFTSKDGLADGAVTAIFEASDGAMWFGTLDGRVSRMSTDGGTGNGPEKVSTKPSPRFTTFGPADGLPAGTIHDIAQDTRGAMWFGRARSDSSPGLIRYDGKSFVAYGADDGPASNFVRRIHFDARGALWLGTALGACHFDASSCTLLDEADGLDSGPVWDIASTADRNVWFMVGSNLEFKLSRFDGEKLVKVTREDGLLGSRPLDLCVDQDGALLVADYMGPIARFDPASAATERARFQPVENSSASNALARSTTGELWFGTDKGAFVLGQSADAEQPLRGVSHAMAGRDGVMWFRTEVGTSCSIWRHEPGTGSPDAGKWMEFKANQVSPGIPLGSTSIRALMPLPDGSLLVGTMVGVVRFDGKEFTPWPPEVPRLQNLRCYGLALAADQSIWLATAEGVFHTDGTAWSNLDTSDGLPENTVNRVHPAPNGDVWIGGWRKGLARYRPSKHTPRSPVLTAQTEREFTDVAVLSTIKTGQRVTFKFDVVDFYTPVEKRQYRWQLFQGTRNEKELAANWQPPGSATQLEQTFADPGAWTLAVQFIDRDLNYSMPTLATLNIVLPWHADARIMAPAAAAGLGLFGWAFVARILYMRKRREAGRLREQLLEEEHKAREAAEAAHASAERAKLEIEAKNEELSAARDAADEANRTKSRFLANMSHELRTPMNAIIGYSEMLQEEAGDLDQKDLIPDLQRIHGAGKHLLALINDILDLSKVEAGKMTLFLEDFEVTTLVHEVAATVQPLIAKNANTLYVECPQDCGTMYADVTKVRQALFNLLSNASKFTERGVISLSVEKLDNVIRFRVSDTGIGMTRDQMGRIFDAFSQADASTNRNYGGTGLGLAISRKFCQLMGGEINVESEPGRGTVFTVTLPSRVMETAPESTAAF